MAAPDTSGSMTKTFHSETKSTVLRYLSLPQSSQLDRTEEACSAEDGQEDMASKRKSHPEKQQQVLEEETSVFLSHSANDSYSSLMVCSSEPDDVIQDSLSTLGNCVSRDLRPHLGPSLHTPHSVPLDYELYRAGVKEVATHVKESWSRVLVPPEMLQDLHEDDQPVSTLVDMEVHYQVKVEENDILQQGCWGSVTGPGDEDQGAAFAENSNNSGVLSRGQLADQHRLPAPLRDTPEGSKLRFWQTDCLAVSLSGTEAWSQLDIMDTEDDKSLDSDAGLALAEEHSENNSSNSDIVHVEQEEAELLEEGAEPDVEGEAGVEAELLGEGKEPELEGDTELLKKGVEPELEGDMELLGKGAEPELKGNTELLGKGAEPELEGDPELLQKRVEPELEAEMGVGADEMGGEGAGKTEILGAELQENVLSMLSCDSGLAEVRAELSGEAHLPIPASVESETLLFLQATEVQVSEELDLEPVKSPSLEAPIPEAPATPLEAECSTPSAPVIALNEPEPSAQDFSLPPAPPPVQPQQEPAPHPGAELMAKPLQQQLPPALSQLDTQPDILAESTALTTAEGPVPDQPLVMPEEAPEQPPPPPSELSFLLYAGATLVAVAAIAVTLLYRKK